MFMNLKIIFLNTFFLHEFQKGDFFEKLIFPKYIQF